MGWAAIVGLLIQVFGPALAAWLADCTEERLTDAADTLPAPATFATEGEAVAAMFDAAIAKLPKYAKLRRKALARMRDKAVVNGKVRTAPLTAKELVEAKRVVSGIRK